MLKKVVFDTNVFVYAADSNFVFGQRAKELLSDTDTEVCITTKSISEIWAVLSKQNKNHDIILSVVLNILQNTTLLFPNQNSVLLHNDLCMQYKPKGNRVFDVEIVAIALTYGINHIATFNTDDFKHIQQITLLT